MKCTPPRAVVWDLDGTLIDSVGDLTEALNELLREHRLPGHGLECVRKMIGGGVVQLIETGFTGAGREIGTDTARTLAPRFLEIYGKRCTRQTRLFDDAEAVLQIVENAGFRQGICTNKPLRVSLDILHELGVIERFASVIGGDSSTRQKPHADPVLACLSALGVEAANAILIGDSRVDVEAARAADMPIILVSHGYSEEPVRDLAPNAVIDRLADLPAALMSMLRAA